MGLGISLGLFFLTAPATVTFESKESKTFAEGPVFNRIRFIPGWKRDIWIMAQSHLGLHAEFKNWNKLAIVVDKSQSPTVATFYQLKQDGKMELSTQPLPYKARCFACHADGPRAIRWNHESEAIVPNALESAALTVWNLRIKIYGHVSSQAGTTFQDGEPFRAEQPVYKRPLGIATCERCHSATGLRNALSLEHLGTALFLVRSGYMPPFPFQLTAQERTALELIR